MSKPSLHNMRTDIRFALRYGTCNTFMSFNVLDPPINLISHFSTLLVLISPTLAVVTAVITPHLEGSRSVSRSSLNICVLAPESSRTVIIPSHFQPVMVEFPWLPLQVLVFLTSTWRHLSKAITLLGISLGYDISWFSSSLVLFQQSDFLCRAHRNKITSGSSFSGSELS